mmetsp:Transcript_39814/g.93798  ORF Transcript_39814/g.93798 Transcript_39814/m.93798 type:complete len:215 (+) Transcript_39814:141-785(+)
MMLVSAIRPQGQQGSQSEVVPSMAEHWRERRLPPKAASAWRPGVKNMVRSVAKSGRLRRRRAEGAAHAVKGRIRPTWVPGASESSCLLWRPYLDKLLVQSRLLRTPVDELPGRRRTRRKPKPQLGEQRAVSRPTRRRNPPDLSTRRSGTPTSIGASGAIQAPLAREIGKVAGRTPGTSPIGDNTVVVRIGAGTVRGPMVHPSGMNTSPCRRMAQ